MKRVGRKTRYCVSCSNTATQEAIFTVDGATIIEKYCDSCAKKNIYNNRFLKSVYLTFNLKIVKGR